MMMRTQVDTDLPRQLACAANATSIAVWIAVTFSGLIPRAESGRVESGMAA